MIPLGSVSWRLDAASSAVAALFSAALWLLYWRLLPRPIAGIPHNRRAAQSIWGDIPSLRREVAVTHEPTAWMRRQAETLGAPLCQVFLRPGGRPILLLADYNEAQDILLRRKEFDRSSFTADIMVGIAPDHHITKKTGPAWKHSRRLLQDLMTPTTLRRIAAPAVYRSVQNMMALWAEKTRLAQGRPFSVASDVHHCMLDALLAFSFGDDLVHTAMGPELAALRGLRTGSLMMGGDSPGPDSPVTFPDPDVHPDIAALMKIETAIEDLVSAPLPRLSNWWLRRKPSFQDLLTRKERYLREQVMAVVDRLGLERKSSPYDDDGRPEDESDGAAPRFAAEHILRRIQSFAAKEGRQPEYWNAAVSDEFLGFIVAGHGTTSDTMLWAVKFLAAHPAVQSRLRAALLAAHPAAAAEGRQPTCDEILAAVGGGGVPYLDATIEETLRFSGPPVTRDAEADTSVLGHPVPRGTTVFLLANGPSCFSPSFDIPDELRSASWHRHRTQQQEAADRRDGGGNDDDAKQQRQRQRRWDESRPQDMGSFRPERWLTAEDSSFNPTAGPQLAFGLGTRGCFGRRLAYVNMKMLLTLMVWNYDLLPVPSELAGMEARLGMVRKPEKCFARLRKRD